MRQAPACLIFSLTACSAEPIFDSIMRFLTAVLTFAIGLIGAGFVKSLFDYSFDAVPEIKTSSIKAAPDWSDEQSPEYVPFSESAGQMGFYGWFVADEFEGMQEVWAIQLGYGGNGSSEGEAVVRTVPIGKDLEDQVAFGSVTLIVHEDYLAFTTERIDRVHYKFEGRFLYGGSSFSQEEKVLQGTLTKFRNGKLVARFPSTFKYAEPYCTL